MTLFKVTFGQEGVFRKMEHMVETCGAAAWLVFCFSRRL